jgi:hypothetical protein
VKRHLLLTGGALAVGLLVAGCGSSSSSSTTTSVASAPTTTAASATTVTTTAPTSTTATTAASSTAAASCPTLAQATAALGGTFTGPISTPIPDSGIVCEYTGSGGNAGVTIFAHQSAAVFAGQVHKATGNPAMPAISGVGDGAYGMTTGGRSVVNAYSNGTHTVVAAQGPGAIGPVVALAKVALADN